MDKICSKWLLAGGVFMALAGCAGAPSHTQDSLAQAPNKAGPRNCLRETGSRLAPAEGRCLASAGRVIEREELERTGAVSISDALNRLLPF